LFSSLWKGKRVLLISQPGQESGAWLPDQLGRALTELTGIQADYESAEGAGEKKGQLSPDAVVILDTPDAMAFASFPSLQALWKRAVVVHSGGGLNDEVIRRLGEACSVLCMEGPYLHALQHAGLRPWPIPYLHNDSNPAYTAAFRIVQPLSMVLGGATPKSVTQSDTCSNGEANVKQRGEQQAVSTLHDVTILITSFLRPGYLRDCLAGIRRNLPECKVIVVDDGGDQSLGGDMEYPF
jgi:hypothetical protein